MDLMRLAQLFGSRPMGLSVLQHLGLVRARWAGVPGHSVWLTRQVSAASSSSLSQLPLDQGTPQTKSSGCSELSQPSPTVSQEEEEEEGFGTLSDKYSSRRMFRKSTTQLYDLRLQEQSAEEDEELDPKPWRGRRNTPHWYFFRCKGLINEGKVSGAACCLVKDVFRCHVPSFFTHSGSSVLPSPLPTAGPARVVSCLCI